MSDSPQWSLESEVAALREALKHHELYCENNKTAAIKMLIVAAGILASVLATIGGQLLVVTGRQQGVIQWRDQLERTIASDREVYAKSTAADRQASADALRTVLMVKETQISELHKALERMADKQDELHDRIGVDVESLKREIRDSKIRR